MFSYWLYVKGGQNLNFERLTPSIAMPTIVTLTLNPAVDKISSVRQVVPEDKLRCSEPHYDPGGGGLNVARAIKILGGEATAWWTRGGPLGELLAQRLDAESVPNRPIPIQNMTRENFIVYEESSTKQYRFGVPGARLSPEELDRCARELRESDPPPEYLVLSGSLPPGTPEDFYARLADDAPPSCRVVIDTSGKPLRAGIEGGAFLIKPNIRELGELAGQDVTQDAQIEDFSRGLVQSGKVQVVVTSLGSAGVVLVTADTSERIRAPVVKIKSKVGAGDSTVAGIVFGLAQGKSIQDAVRLGVAAGSAAVMTEGTQLCRKEDTLRLYDKMGSSP
jgi:6-phosphofructokinase 2